MMMRRLLAIALLGVVVLPTPVAYAFPPDPSWVWGLYDDDDFDDARNTIASSVATLDTPPPSGARLLLGVSASLGFGNDDSPASPPAAPYQTRAPPSG